MKNTHQVVGFPAQVLVKTPVPKEVQELQLNLVKSIQSDSPPTEADEKKKRLEIAEKLPENLKSELDQFGVLLPMDKVQVHMKLGTFFFDLFLSYNPAPLAPLAKFSYQKKCQDLAAILDADEFELPAEVAVAANAILGDDAAWGRFQAVVWVEAEAEEGKEAVKKYLELNKDGINFFQHVINSAIQSLSEVDNEEQT